MLLQKLKRKKQKKIMQNKYIIFDCDGTIVNTYPLIMESFKRTFKKLLPDYKLTQEELNSFFGPSLRKTFSIYFKEEEVDDVINTYRSFSKELMKDWIHVFDGIMELLDYLKNNHYPISVLSNKAYDMIMYGFELVGLTEYFDIVVGYEQMPEHKPSPKGLDVIKDFYKIDDTYNNDIYLIGDTAIDIKTAIAGNINSVGVTWCITKRADFEQANAKYIIDKPSELIKILEE